MFNGQQPGKMKIFAATLTAFLLGSVLTYAVLSHLIQEKIEANNKRTVEELFEAMLPIYKELEVENIPESPATIGEALKPAFRLPLFDFSDN